LKGLQGLSKPYSFSITLNYYFKISIITFRTATESLLCDSFYIARLSRSRILDSIVWDL